MEKEQLSAFDILIETHTVLERQGPGSSEMTLRALSFIDNLGAIRRAADFGCGTGTQTMLIAQSIPGEIVGLDLSDDFIRTFNENAEKASLGGKASGIVGSMLELPFQKEEFDLIWSEGAIDGIGFENGLSYWNSFLRKGGYVAVTCPSWFSSEHPKEIEKFWLDAGSGLDTVDYNIGVMQKCGYSFAASFILPENCWTDNYFIPREAAQKALLEKHPDNKNVIEAIESSKYEAELYSKYKQYYGYAFYIGRKM